jgi:hypothetical protein
MPPPTKADFKDACRAIGATHKPFNQSSYATYQIADYDYLEVHQLLLLLLRDGEHTVARGDPERPRSKVGRKAGLGFGIQAELRHLPQEW